MPLPDDLDSEPRRAPCWATKQRKQGSCAGGLPVGLAAVSLVLDLSGFLLSLSQATM